MTDMTAIEALAPVLPAPVAQRQGAAVPASAVGAAAKTDVPRDPPRRPEPGTRGAIIDIVI